MLDYLNYLADDTLLDELLAEDQAASESSLAASQASLSSSQNLFAKRVPHLKPKITSAFRQIHDLSKAAFRRTFSGERIFDRELKIFTEPFNTTVTLEANLGGDIIFTEEEITPFLCHSEHIHGFDSNFAHTRSLDYYETPKPVKSTRGRKKKISTKKPRKVQGDGSSFNSQVTFLARNPGGDEPRYFRIKVFRTGKLQIPGIKQQTVESVYESIGHVKDHLRGLLLALYASKGLPREMAPIAIQSITPVMKNYRFMISIMRPKQILRLDQLKIMLQARSVAPGTVGAGDAKIVHVKYTPEDPSKLSVVFSTPIPGKDKKGTRVNVFSSGRINILGAFEVGATQKICSFLHDLIEVNALILIATEGVPFLANISSDPTARIYKIFIEAYTRVMNRGAAQ